MIYAVTGHTAGFGKYIAQSLSTQGHSVVGVSRTTGFDLTKDIDTIVDHLKHCDVIINNSSGGNMQTQLLVRLYQTYRNFNKTVVNVGSWITRIHHSELQDIDLLHYTDKSFLLHTSELINRNNTELKSVYLSWGFHPGNPILDRYPQLLDTTTVESAVDQLVAHTR